mmetsp:Transcript_4610/g.6881  ORF Transcript_4610/g.6881 Transcript_4610/m.6881 type:complete len:172 (-) Transcript_4610:4066-4581(-)
MICLSKLGLIGELMEKTVDALLDRICVCLVNENAWDEQLRECVGLIGGEVDEIKGKRVVNQEQLKNAILALDVLVNPGTVDKAMHICQQKRSIEKFQTSTGTRECFHVKGSHGAKYLCLDGYCSCPDFTSKLQTAVPYCKHLLAVRFGQVLGVIGQVHLASDQDFAKQLFV